MSAVVNKSGKRVAPKAPPRRRVGAGSVAASSASPRLSLEPTKQPESHDPTIGEALQTDGSTTLATTASHSAVGEIENAVEPSPKRRRVGNETSAHITVDLPGQSVTAASSTPTEHASQGVAAQTPQSPQVNTQASEIPQVLSSSAVAAPTPHAKATSSHSQTPSAARTGPTLNGSAPTSEALSGVSQGSATRKSSRQQASGFVDVVPYEIPRPVARQITWNLKTGKTTDEAVGPGRVKRKSSRSTAQNGDSRSKGKQPATLRDEEDAPATGSRSEPQATGRAKKGARKGGGQKTKASARGGTSGDAVLCSATSPDVAESSSQAAQSKPSARLANRERRKLRAASRRETEDSTVNSIEGVTTVHPSQSRQGDPATGSPDEQDGTTRKKKTKPRAGTPEGFEAVQIVPSVVTMFELSARNIRTGWKSEREKMMAQIDWEEVKRRRRADELALAQQPRPGTSDANGHADNEHHRADEESGDVDEDDLDEQLIRAVAKNKRKQQTLKIRLVNGEHVVDEASQFVDRHALANDEDEDVIEEVEEDDLTKKFNTQSLIRLRRKDPAERVRNWDPWTMESTNRFYDCLRKFGTDFMVIARCFPGRTRREVKAKFVREERDDPERVHDALTGAKDGEESWNLDEFKALANLSSENFIDPVEFKAELLRREEDRKREIDEQKRETAELQRQKQLAGANSDDEAEAGAAASEAEAPSKSKKKTGKEKRKRERKRKGHPKDGGEMEEILDEVQE